MSAATPEDDGLSVSYKGASLTARGIAVYAVLAVLALIGAQLYAGARIESTMIAQNKIVSDTLVSTTKQVAVEHGGLRTAQEQTSCILTMSQEDRTKFRDRFQSGDFKRWCPWMLE